MLDTKSIHTFDFHHPQQNLSVKRESIASPEAKFGEQFARVYKDRFEQVHSRTTRRQTLFIREMPIDSHGIADLVVFNWDPAQEPFDVLEGDFQETALTVRAFEFKMNDWRGGLMQAHRYRYFSHTVALVLPMKKIRVAQKNLELFKTLRVGLWGFDSDSEAIARLYTPRPKRQFVEKYRKLVISLACKTAALL